jgi:hypothetical protein
MSERVYVGEDLFGFQIGKFLIAIVAQEQRLAPVADENHGPMGDCKLIHIQLLKQRRRLSGRSPSMPERRI